MEAGESRAEQQRREKGRRVEEGNVEVRERLARSAEAWRKSREVVRRAAKGAQDSSEIRDHVFTDNDHLEPIGYDPRSSVEDATSYANNRPFNVIQDPSLRPRSQYANSANPFSQYLQDRIETMRDIDPNRAFFQQENSYNNFRNSRQFQSSNIHNYAQQSIPRFPLSNNYYQNYAQPQNWNHSNNVIYNSREMQPNMYNYHNQPSFPPRFIQDNHYPQNSWNYQNSNHSNQDVYNQRDMMTNFYHNSNPISYRNHRFSNSFQPPPIPYNPYMNPYRPPREDNSSIESMKKYMMSLLDKLELLNETVVKLKHEKNNQRYPRSVSQCAGNHNFNHSHCCTHPKPLINRQISCSCKDLRRPFSSGSQHPHIHTASCYNHDNILHNHIPQKMHSSCSNLRQHQMNYQHENLPFRNIQVDPYINQYKGQNSNITNNQRYNNIRAYSMNNYENLADNKCQVNVTPLNEYVDTVDVSGYNTVVNVQSDNCKGTELTYQSEPYANNM